MKAKVVKHGRSQAIVLPKAFRVSTKVVYLKRVGKDILVMEKDPWETFWEGVAELSPSFFEQGREQPPLEEREPLD